MSKNVWESPDHSAKADKSNISTSVRSSSVLTCTNSVQVSAEIWNHSTETSELIEQFSKTEYLWWTENLKIPNERKIWLQEFQLVMRNDPITKGWGIQQRGCDQRRKNVLHKHLANNNSENYDFNNYEREVMNINESHNGLQDCFLVYWQMVELKTSNCKI